MALTTGPAVITDDVDLFHIPPPDFKTAAPHTSLHFRFLRLRPDRWNDLERLQGL
jgi:hypothetical protein